MAKKPPVEFDADRPIYDRQTLEPDKSWFAFRTYRDLPARGYRAAAEIYKKKYGNRGKITTIENYMNKISIQWRWQERCVEWDRMIDNRLRIRKMRAVEEMEARHLDLAHLASSTAAMGLEAIKKAVEKAKAKNEEYISVDEIVKLAKFGVTTERIVQGEPTAIEEQRHSVDVEDKRKALLALAKNPDLLKKIRETLADDS